MGEQSGTEAQTEEREVNFCRLLNFLFAAGEKGSNAGSAGQRESASFSGDKLGVASPVVLLFLGLKGSKTRVKRKKTKQTRT